jgi:predicted RNA methylase
VRHDMMWLKDLVYRVFSMLLLNSSIFVLIWVDFISASTNPGAIVLDSFAGSGSTLIAAQKLGRQFIGIELDPHWVDQANAKLHPSPSLC